MKIKFIQLDEKAEPIVHDGFGYQVKFINAVPAHRRDGRDVVIMYTGYKIIVPDGYIGEVYDTPVANIISCHRQQLTQFVTNSFQYETDPKRANVGFYCSYEVTGGISSVIFDPRVAYIGIAFSKVNTLTDFEVEKAIVEIPKEETKDDNK